MRTVAIIDQSIHISDRICLIAAWHPVKDEFVCLQAWLSECMHLVLLEWDPSSRLINSKTYTPPGAHCVVVEVRGIM